MGRLVIVLALLACPYIYLAIVYKGLPETVPIHFDLHGRADGFSGKSSLWMHLSLLSGVALLVYGLLNALPAIDPKRKGSKGLSSNMRKTVYAVILLFVGINASIVYSAQSNALPANKLLMIMIGLFFLYMGNQMNSMKPNYFIGIRVPWTLDSEENWRATHRIGSRSFMIGGAVLVLTPIFFSALAAGICLAVISGLMTLVPVIYSFIYFKRHS